MKILVFSDSHGDIESMKRAIKKHRHAEVIIFCGDGAREFSELRVLYPDKAFFGVTGNCDWYTDLPSYQEIELCNKRIFITHGHLFGVKNGISRLIDMGRSNGFDIMLFGHTHQQFTSAEGAMLVMNPGSVGCDGEYGMLDIDEDTGIVTATEYPKSDIPPLKMNTISSLQY